MGQSLREYWNRYVQKNKTKKQTEAWWWKLKMVPWNVLIKLEITFGDPLALFTPALCNRELGLLLKSTSYIKFRCAASVFPLCVIAHHSNSKSLSSFKLPLSVIQLSPPIRHVPARRTPAFHLWFDLHAEPTCAPSLRRFDTNIQWIIYQ